MVSSNYHKADLVTIILLLFVPPSYVMGVPTYPYIEKVCEEMNCGKGSCKVDNGSPFGFTCECLPGWKRTISDEVDYFTFLPCLIPDCNLNYACEKTPPTVPKIPIPDNPSLSDLCNWIYCGEGKCSQSNTNTYSCKCNPGYYNLLNTSTFPCYSDCNFGSDCTKLGINNYKGLGNSILPGKLQWMAISIFSLVMNQLWN